MVTKVIALHVLFLFLIASQSNSNANNTDSTENATCTECYGICDTYGKLELGSKNHTCEKIIMYRQTPAILIHNMILIYTGRIKRSVIKYEKCEKMVDTLISNHSICPNVTTTTVTDPQCPTATTTITVSRWNTTTIMIQHNTTITPSPSTCNVQPSSTCIPTPNTVNDISSQSSCPCMTAAVNGIQFAAFDKVIVGLLGLSLLLLVVVTTAWVCTCLITKKRKRY